MWEASIQWEEDGDPVIGFPFGEFLCLNISKLPFQQNSFIELQFTHSKCTV